MDCSVPIFGTVDAKQTQLCGALNRQFPVKQSGIHRIWNQNGQFRLGRRTCMVSSAGSWVIDAHPCPALGQQDSKLRTTRKCVRSKAPHVGNRPQTDDVEGRVAG